MIPRPALFERLCKKAASLNGGGFVVLQLKFLNIRDIDIIGGHNPLLPEEKRLLHR